MRLEDDGLFDKVVSAVVQVAPQAARAAIRPSTQLVADLRVDSLKVAELSILLEESFGFMIFLPELLATVDDPRDLTVESLVRFVRSKVDSEGGVRAA